MSSVSSRHPLLQQIDEGHLALDQLLPGLAHGRQLVRHRAQLAGQGEELAGQLPLVVGRLLPRLVPRVGIDAQSERIDSLIFDDLLSRGEDLNVAPGLAERWEIPDTKTYVFHLHSGAKFHDGTAVTSRDVKWTFDSLLQGKIRSTKSAVYKYVDHIEAPDESTVIFHMKQADSTLLWNLSDGAIGIVPYASGEEMSQYPVGSGPFKFVSADMDREVVLKRNDDYW